jgi:hypothetical protein
MANINPLQWLIDAWNTSISTHGATPFISNPYQPGIENGVDIPLPYHTPITSLTNGTVVGYTPQFGGGGVVAIETSLNNAYGTNGTADVYYQHLSDLVSGIYKGMQVKVGDLIGYSGGQVGYGDNPSSTKFSSGPHIEVGINPNPKDALDIIWNPNHRGPQVNPTSFINDELLLAQADTAANNVFSGKNTTDPPTGNPFIDFINGLKDDGSNIIVDAKNTLLPNIADFSIRGSLIIGGVLLIIIGIIAIVFHSTDTPNNRAMAVEAATA